MVTTLICVGQLVQQFTKYDVTSRACIVIGTFAVETWIQFITGGTIEANAGSRRRETAVRWTRAEITIVAFPTRATAIKIGADILFHEI